MLLPSKCPPLMRTAVLYLPDNSRAACCISTVSVMTCPHSKLASLRLGVTRVHSGNNSTLMARMVSSVIKHRQLVDTMTGSYTTNSGQYFLRHPAMTVTIPASCTIPILTASGCKSSITDMICALTISAGIG